MRAINVIGFFEHIIYEIKALLFPSVIAGKVKAGFIFNVLAKLLS
jgi:hypothetical protein